MNKKVCRHAFKEEHISSSVFKTGSSHQIIPTFLSVLQSHVRQEETPLHNTDSLTTGHSYFKES